MGTASRERVDDGGIAMEARRETEARLREMTRCQLDDGYSYWSDEADRHGKAGQLEAGRQALRMRRRYQNEVERRAAL